MKRLITLIIMTGAAISMWAKSDERDEFRCDSDRQTVNSGLPCPESLKSVTHSRTNPGGGTSLQYSATNIIRRTAPKAQMASQGGGRHLGNVTKDKLQYAVFQFDDAPTPVATLMGWLDGYDYYSDVVVPDVITYEGQAVPVTSINDYCFVEGWGLTSLSIGKNVKYIGAYSFYGCSFTELSVPDCVTIIMSGAFTHCPLNSILFENPASLDVPIVIGDLAFAYTDITSVEIPARLKVVDDYSFRASRRNPFFSCGKLESITVNPRYYDKDPHRNFTLEINQGALCSRIYADDRYPEYLAVIAYPAAKYCEEFSLTSPVLDAFAGAFSNSNIGKISLTATSEPRAVDDEVSVNMCIEYNAFDYSGITELNLSAKGPITFRTPFALDCNNLYKYNLSESITNFKIIDGALCAKKVGEPYLVSYPSGRTVQEYMVPNEILHLADYCFATNMYIKEITLPTNLISIGDNAFAYCENLERLIYTGNCLESVGDNDFTSTKIISSAPQGEVSLGNWLIGYNGDVPSNFVITETITNAMPDIFRDNGSITSVTFPQNFENIPNGMFRNCYQLTAVQFSKNLKTIGQYAFDCSEIIDYEVDTSNSRSTESRTLTIPDGVTEIGRFAFNSSRLGDKLVLPSSLSLLDDYSLGGFYEEVEIHRSTPPENKEGIQSIFTPGTRTFGTLIIPKDADILSFTGNPYWNFANVVNGDFASVDNIEFDSDKIIVSSGSISSTNGESLTLYNSAGQLIGTGKSFGSLAPGIYIVRLGSDVAKYVIR